METTLRMRRCGMDRSLDGYVFADRKHAHLWLSQSFIDRAQIVLEEVEVGPLRTCPRCGGLGHRQDVKLIRRLSAEEVANV
jgi:hypothetical protein